MDDDRDHIKIMRYLKIMGVLAVIAAGLYFFQKPSHLKDVILGTIIMVIVVLGGNAQGLMNKSNRDSLNRR